MSGMCDVVCRTIFDVDRYTIQWRIENYSNILLGKGEKIESPVFTTGKNEVKWTLSYYPGYNQEIYNYPGSQPFSSVALELKSETTISVFYEISSINKSNEKFRTAKIKQRFQAPGGIFKISAFDIDSRNTSQSTQINFSKTVIFIEFLNERILLAEKDKLLDNDTLVLNLDMEVVEEINYSNSIRPKILTDLNHISEDYLRLLSSSIMSDFIITVRNRQFKVHKQILSARSPVFAAMFRHNLQETKTNSLDIKDVEPDLMECVIQYIYSGKCEKLDEKAVEILPVADKYSLEHLKLMCEEMLSFQLNLNNAPYLLFLANTYSAWKLKEKSIDIITRNFKNILETSEWKRMASENKDLALEVMSALISKPYK